MLHQWLPLDSFVQAVCGVKAQEALAKVADGQRGAHIGRLNNVLMQMRKNCNHPDLVTGPYDRSATFPPAAELVTQCGKMQLLDRLLRMLKAGGHKVLIFSQVRSTHEYLIHGTEEGCAGTNPCSVTSQIAVRLGDPPC